MNEMETVTTNTENVSRETTLTEIKADTFAVTEKGNNGQIIRETTTDDQVKLFNAATGSAETVKSIIGQTLEVTDIIVTSADVHELRDDELSPIVNKPVVHFYTSDGHHYSTLSNGIVRTTKALLECGICPTVENPIKVKFKTVETKRGTAHIFELA